jgi:uncharacterized membrane-anchored protein
MRKWTAVAAGLVILAAANYTIFAREKLITEGRVVLLELAPVDPRSLMQGDYMALAFRVSDEAFGRGTTQRTDGRIVVQIDGRGVAKFARFDDGQPLAPAEQRLRYRIRDSRAKFATNAYFFQEGTAGRYTGARYGEFRVAPDGEALLTGLRGKDLEPLR